ncbi:MAG: amidase, partial [Gammaproteobacteria bacterium]|nr:amidase [Gammaproteobacteria bacterium]
DVEALLTNSIGLIAAQQAVVIDDIHIDMSGVSDAEYTVLLYEFKAGLAAYLERSSAPVQTLTDVIAFNDANSEVVMPHFGQEVLLAANATGGLDDPAYLEALDASGAATRTALEQVFAEHDLDALAAISNGPAWMTDLVNGDSFHIGSSSFAAVSGYPSVTVPAGFVSGLPVGLTFIGQPWSEQQLIGVAYAFEQAGNARRPPVFDKTSEK